jgi:CheY-like chemotaxis protein
LMAGPPSTFMRVAKRRPIHLLLRGETFSRVGGLGHMTRFEHLSPNCVAARPRSILVVEDEIIVRLAIASYLRDAGYRVVESSNAAEAIARFKSLEPVDVVFTDVQMPGTMDGLMLALWIHDHHPCVPVLATSGKGDAAVSSGLIARDAFFAKPYRPEAVAARIQSLLEV